MGAVEKKIEVFLVKPRGFCAGVRRAIRLVEDCLQKFGSPVFVRHEIVHNRHVIENLKQRGVIFIEEISELKDKDRPLIFSAHGVGKNIENEARKNNLNIIDATCPLVKNVHRQLQKLEATGAEIILIGKASHAEVIGTCGQAQNPEKVHIVGCVEEAKILDLPPNCRTGIVTQTTLSLDDTREIIEILRRRIPNVEMMEGNDICYATTNRQQAVKELAGKCEALIVIGSKNSSNSCHLRETALKFGAKVAFLIDDASELNWEKLADYSRIGITAGASAPEYLVAELLEALRQRYDKIKIHEDIIIEEKVAFKN